MLAHDPHGPLMIHRKLVPMELSGNPPVAIARVLGADFPYFFDDFCLSDRLSSRLVIVGGPSKVHELASSSDGEATGPVTIDVGSLLRDGGVFEAPLKNSSSIVSLPTIRSRPAILTSWAFRRLSCSNSGSNSPPSCFNTQIRIRLRAMSYFRDKLFRLSPVKELLGNLALERNVE
jgi:hypothetical protein